MKDSLTLIEAQKTVDVFYPGQNKVLDSIKVEKEDGFLGETTTTYYLQGGESFQNTPMVKGMIGGVIFLLIILFVIFLYIKLVLYVRTIAKYAKKKLKE
jgi:hypothetical protein